jgi:hypothetical protein
MELLEQAYELFSCQILAEADFHTFVMEVIDKDQSVKNKKRGCKVLGKKVIA